jgi:hypothetical protein
MHYRFPNSTAKGNGDGRTIQPHNELRDALASLKAVRAEKDQVIEYRFPSGSTLRAGYREGLFGVEGTRSPVVSGRAAKRS